MSILYFSKSSQSADGKPVFEASETKSSGGYGNIIMLPEGSGKIDVMTIKLDCTAGSGRVMASGDNRDDILTGEATWDTLIAQTTNSQYTGSFDPITAIRLVRTSGTVKIKVTSQ